MSKTVFAGVSTDQFHLFKKKPYLSIRDLQCKSKHIVQNKLSDKLSRRDVHYYDLYALHEPGEDYENAMRDGFPCT